MNTSELEIWTAYSRQHIASTHRFLQKSVVRKGRILRLQMREIYINLYSYESTMFGALERLIEQNEHHHRIQREISIRIDYINELFTSFPLHSVMVKFTKLRTCFSQKTEF